MNKDFSRAIANSAQSTLDAYRTLVSGGLGAYLRAVVLLGGSLGLARILLTRVQSATEVTRALESVLRIPQEPFRPDPIPTRNAALIGDLSIDWDICDRRSPLSAELDRAHDLFTKAYVAEPRSPPVACWKASLLYSTRWPPQESSPLTAVYSPQLRLPRAAEAMLRAGCASSAPRP